MPFKISELFPKGGDDQIYIDTIVNLNEAYSWGLPINATMTWPEIEGYLSWIDSITSHIKYSEVYELISTLKPPTDPSDGGLVLLHQVQEQQVLLETVESPVPVNNVKVITDVASFEIT